MSMNEIGEHENAFAIPDFGKTMRLAQFEIEPTIHTSELWQPLQYGSDWEQGLQTDGSCNLERFDYLNLDLPDLSSFNYGILETSETLESSSTLSVGDSDIERDPAKDDSPPFQHVLYYKEPYLKLNSWERFYNKRFEEPRSVYLSEGGNAAFDAALNLGFKGAHSLQLKKGNVVESLPIIKVSDYCWVWLDCF